MNRRRHKGSFGGDQLGGHYRCGAAIMMMLMLMVVMMMMMMGMIMRIRIVTKGALEVTNWAVITVVQLRGGER